jgi:hypothetical protein
MGILLHKIWQDIKILLNIIFCLKA